MRQKLHQKLSVNPNRQRREFDLIERELVMLIGHYWNHVEKNQSLRLKMQHSVKKLQEIKFYLVVHREIRQVVQ